jgi:Zn-dependent peptidase ImmA (M78 family)
VNSNDSVSVERKRFTIAHELGHILMHSSSFDECCDEEKAEEEDEANQFAAELLMPQEGFRKEWSQMIGLHWVDAVLQVKQCFGVSYRTVLYRLCQEQGDPAIYQRFSALFKEKYKRDLKNHYEPNTCKQSDPVLGVIEPQQLNRMVFKDERFASLARKAYGEELISMSRAAQMLGLSLFDMRERIGSWH